MLNKDPGSLLTTLRMAGLVRGGTLTVTMDAASSGGGTDTAKLVELFPDLGADGDSFIIVDRIGTQDVFPSTLTITARDLNRGQDSRLLLDANLVNDQLLIGDLTRGVAITIRNRAAIAVTVVISFVTLTAKDGERLLGLIRGV